MSSLTIKNRYFKHAFYNEIINNTFIQENGFTKDYPSSTKQIMMN